MKSLAQKISSFLLILTLVLAGVELPAPGTVHATTLNVEYLIVAGGGGGGSSVGGGGGAGGLREGNTTLSPDNYSIVVGAGGAGSSVISSKGTSGTASSFNGIEAAGGGGGGSENSAPGAAGGSGGGAASQTGTNAGGAGNTPSVSPSQGNNGGGEFGGADFNKGGGGGGGASAAGGDGGDNLGGNGGAGTASSISGASVTYAGGGGGGSFGGTPGAGGAGGGGNGSGTTATAASGTANTGGGGGGGGQLTSNPFTLGPGGAGGSGIVIIRYLGSQQATGGAITSSGGYTIHTFTTSGTFTYTGPPARTIRLFGTRTTADARTAHTITANGNAQVDTAQSKFGGASGLFDGSGDYLSTASTADFNMQSAGDWTVDFWVRPNGVGAGIQTFIHLYNGVLTNQGLHIYRSGSAVLVDNGNTGSGLSAGTLVTLTWHHIAVVETGGTILVFLDGTQIDTEAAQNYGDANSQLLAGRYVDGQFSFNGHLDEIRISRGIARWTADFTPPSAPYTHDQYSRLLIHADGADASTAFTDDSYNTTPIRSLRIIGTRTTPDARTANTATVGGNAQIDTAQSKFGGASALFDGTGDYLSYASDTWNQMGSGDFTIDFWARSADTNAGARQVMGKNDGTSAGSYLFNQNGTSLLLYMSSNGSSWDVANGRTVTNVFSAGTWVHIALVRNGTNITTYIDGVSADSFTSSATLYSGDSLEIGGVSTSPYFNGHLDEFRVSKGIARWTSNFTPPSAPYTHDQYTKLLLHMDGADASTAFTDTSYDSTPNRQLIIYPQN